MLRHTAAPYQQKINLPGTLTERGISHCCKRSTYRRTGTERHPFLTPPGKPDNAQLTQAELRLGVLTVRYWSSKSFAD